ncbi:MAG TPA: LemA family protein [Chitinophagaceae bacterium]|nr:LemA family protein [Chitinophagaceae bacterium]MCC6635914.1 LemA family protein [Chitinophagaceae bacterium]HMZ46519.1 LemA family protein [Chitinophagaceae bacterium]HNF29817.1 LemA family protein [Chitinophagaceae bacterium]HNM34953.1 LemA family protein [Chitinophagaceae bacterium]
MRTNQLSLLVIGGIILLLGGWSCSKYNGLVKTDVEVQKVWGNVETNYQRRTDLYSSVIKTIEGSANFEKSTLKDVINARAAATQVKVDINDPESLAKYQAAQGQLQSAFGRLMAVAEAYPDLKTTKSFQDFQAQIEGTENRINVARQDYNKAVQNYNLKVRTFPNNIFAGFFGFKSKEFYKADPGTEKAPEVNFNIK